ncbi:MAG: LysM peptidoglycan-binding domain-containing protein [Flavobacteriaceae bacterium]|nr:LysM peptidoglycan-binding domain-containing protein [Flavobacteriaceae bacterium]
MPRIVLLLFLVGALSAVSCKSKKTVSSVSKKPQTERPIRTSKPTPPKVSEHTPTVVKVPKKNASYAEIVTSYVDSYKQIAMDEMISYGIPASITLAQGILESGAGRGDLSLRANNHFGIKCHRGWTGESVRHDDDELQECFRKYKDPKYSFRDHSLFLTERSRYQDLFKLDKSDYKGWAKGLKKAGYATDPKYPDKLIRIIETYGLARYDAEILGSSEGVASSDTSPIQVHTVVRGDTLYNIARRFNMSVQRLKEYNGLTSDTISLGQVLYLQPVKN